MALLERWQPVDLRSPPDEAEYLGDPQQLVDAAGFVAGLLRRPAWHAQAACRGAGPARWFPGQGEPLEAARAICAGCAVQAECSDAAIDERHGIWAGTSARQRRELRRTIADAA